MRLVGNWVNLILHHATLPYITFSLAGVTLLWLLTQKRGVTFKPKVNNILLFSIINCACVSLVLVDYFPGTH